MIKKRFYTPLKLFQPLSALDWNGVPQGYKIYYKSSVDAQFTLLEVSADTNNYRLKDLQEYMQYDVKMQAYNDVGSSDYSPVIQETTRESSKDYF